MSSTSDISCLQHKQRDKTYTELVQFAPARHFAPTKVWTDANLRETAFQLLDVTQHAMEAINVEHCIFFGTLLGTVRQGGPIPWDDKIDLIASGDDWKQNGEEKVREFDMILARHSMIRVPFYGGFRVSRVDRKQTLRIEGYRHSWPVLNIYLFEKRMRRERENWSLGLVIQGKPEWCASYNYQTQWFYDYADIFPCRIVQCGDTTARIPCRARTVLIQDYGEECLDIALPSRWSHKNECYTNYEQDPVPMELIYSLYAMYGWQPLNWWTKEPKPDLSTNRPHENPNDDAYNPYEAT